MTHPVTLAYLEHMSTTGLVTGFRIDHPSPPHADLRTALLAVLDGELPQDPTACEVRAFHRGDIDESRLDALLDVLPPWGRVLLLVQDPARGLQEARARQLLVRKGLDRWRRRHTLD